MGPKMNEESLDLQLLTLQNMNGGIASATSRLDRLLRVVFTGIVRTRPGGGTQMKTKEAHARNHGTPQTSGYLGARGIHPADCSRFLSSIVVTQVPSIARMP